VALSPAHQFGQIIGDLLETAIEPLLSKFARTHKLYLDKKGSRPARAGSRVGWTDLRGNKHDLDFVLERDGSASKIGTPAAFIETAWRRYTKHSRNKAQEIQGAILPLVATYEGAAPFIGAVLAGVFTSGALTQLKSNGFTVLYFPYESVVTAFKLVGIDAHCGESTPDANYEQKVTAWRALSEPQRKRVARALVTLNTHDVEHFMQSLERAVTRQIELIRILPLHGVALEWVSVEEAITFISDYGEDDGAKPIVRYEVQLRYSNGETIEGRFADKEGTIHFLRRYQPLPPLPAV